MKRTQQEIEEGLQDLENQMCSIGATMNIMESDIQLWKSEALCLLDDAMTLACDRSMDEDRLVNLFSPKIKEKIYGIERCLFSIARKNVDYVIAWRKRYDLGERFHELENELKELK